jgi:NAD(P)-dependent dehydrogenase (short-subunit alcohol dehydrogenase family)
MGGSVWRTFDTMPAITNVVHLLSLRGKVALITRATGHLGSSMATGLADAGATVVVSSRRLDEAKRLASEHPIADSAH